MTDILFEEITPRDMADAKISLGNYDLEATKNVWFYAVSNVYVFLFDKWHTTKLNRTGYS